MIIEYEDYREPPVSLWPVAIFESRYGGIYEGGCWFAVPECESVPHGAHGDDSECAIWFSDNVHKVGIGATPNEALKNLIVKSRSF